MTAIKRTFVQLVYNVFRTCPQQLGIATTVPPCGLPTTLNEHDQAVCPRHGVVAWPHAMNGRTRGAGEGS